MKTYRIGIHFEEGVVLTVEAESEEAAQQIAMDAVHDFGGTEYPKEFKQDCVHRDFFVTNADISERPEDFCQACEDGTCPELTPNEDSIDA